MKLRNQYNVIKHTCRPDVQALLDDWGIEARLILVGNDIEFNTADYFKKTPSNWKRPNPYWEYTRYALELFSNGVTHWFTFRRGSPSNEISDILSCLVSDSDVSNEGIAEILDLTEGDMHQAVVLAQNCEATRRRLAELCPNLVPELRILFEKNPV